jgi:hypothetical protein
VFENLGAGAEDSVAEVTFRAEMFEGVKRRTEYRRLLAQANAWTAAWFWPIVPEGPRPPTQALYATLVHSGSPLPKETAEFVDHLTAEHAFFHFELAFPEVFTVQRGGFDVCLGNPPYVGGMKITGAYGDKVHRFLKSTTADVSTGGRVDLAAYFLRRGFDLLRAGGSLSFITTNTVGEGDTNHASLVPITSDWGGELVDVIRSQPWTGEATVSVTVLHLYRGKWKEGRTRDGVPVEYIPADFGVNVGRSSCDPLPLPENEGTGFLGANLMATGFELTEADRDRLLASEPHARQVIKPFYGGRDLMNRPNPEVPVRWVIDFGNRSLEKAQEYPEALEIVRKRVKPQRDAGKDPRARTNWWRFGRPGAALQEAILSRKLTRVIAIPEVSKHLRPVWLPTGAVYQHKLGVLTFDDDFTFGIVASSIHWLWVTKRCSTMRVDPSFNPARDFGTLPRPVLLDGALKMAVVKGSVEYERSRRELAFARSCGLTKLYNDVDDPTCTNQGTSILRQAQEELDRAAVAAYGWDDLEVHLGHYPTERFGTRWTFAPDLQQEIDERLLKLNLERANL